jgi:hypothetical protein
MRTLIFVAILLAVAATGFHTGQLGFRRGEQLHFGGSLFLHAMQSASDSLQLWLSLIEVQTNVTNQIRLVRF